MGQTGTQDMLAKFARAPLDITGRFCYLPPQFAVEAIAEAIWH
jgi:hypothetical protein